MLLALSCRVGLVGVVWVFMCPILRADDCWQFALASALVARCRVYCLRSSVQVRKIRFSHATLCALAGSLQLMPALRFSKETLLWIN